MAYWDEAPLPRDQIVLIATTLDDRLPEDHPVRLFYEILSKLKWSAWENHYCQVAGQPAVPPMVMAGAILYGLSQGIRSSRRLEWACGNAVDFIWLVEGRTIDHSSFCKFRTRFEKELKDLFKQVGRLAMSMGLMRLNEVSLDGTRVQANSSRHATATAKTLAEREAALSGQIDEMFARARQQDEQAAELFGENCSSQKLPPELSSHAKRREVVRKALAAAEAAEARRGEQDASKRPVKVPVADPDSMILPNKEGGFAPNYNPVAAIDGHRGLIAESEVPSGAAEAETVLPTLEKIEADYGQLPAQCLADTTFATGPNLSGLAERGVEAFMPADANRTSSENPAVRPDPTQPVAECDWPKLPRRAQSKKLDRSAFVYDPQADCYHCPMGKKLEPEGTRQKERLTGDDALYRVYRCTACAGCPLAAACLSGAAKSRTVSRDQHEERREELAVRMQTARGRQIYARRAWMSETPHAVLKQVMGMRKFLLRGLDKVRIEWRWACTAYNLRKVVTWVASLRAQVRLAVA